MGFDLQQAIRRNYGEYYDIDLDAREDEVISTAAAMEQSQLLFLRDYVLKLDKMHGLSHSLRYIRELAGTRLQEESLEESGV